MISYVYILKFSNGKLYVGVSVDPKQRLRTHLKSNTVLRGAFQKHGQPELLVVFRGEREKCFENEQYLTDLLQTVVPNGYNLQRGGTGGSVPSELSRLRMSKAKQGKKVLAKTKARMMAAHKNRLPISEETRCRMSESAKRRGASDAVMVKLQEGRRQKTAEGIAANTRRKLSEAAIRQWVRWRGQQSPQSA
jgi:group I intron endonuclease